MSRALLRGEALRTTYAGNTAIFVDDAIDVVMAWHAAEPTAGHDARAVVLFEQFRACALTDLLAGAEVDVVPPRAGLVARTATLQRQVAVATPPSGRRHDAAARPRSRARSRD